MREASVRRTKPPAGNPRCGSVPCGADRRARATKQAAAAAGPGPTPPGVWSRYPAARGLFCYVLLEAGREGAAQGGEGGVHAAGLGRAGERQTQDEEALHGEDDIGHVEVGVVVRVRCLSADLASASEEVEQYGHGIADVDLTIAVRVAADEPGRREDLQ